MLLQKEERRWRSRSRAVSALSGERGREIWDDQQWQGALSVSARTRRVGGRFLRTYAYPGCLPEVKQQIVEMTLNGSGIRDIARVLQVGPNTVIKELKKKRPRSRR